MSKSTIFPSRVKRGTHTLYCRGPGWVVICPESTVPSGKCNVPIRHPSRRALVGKSRTSSLKTPIEACVLLNE